MIKVPYIKLKELCTVNQGLQIPISKRFKKDGPNRFFYITVQFLKNGHLEKFYIENPPKSSICKPSDLIVVRTGSTGKILTGIEGCFHNNFFKVNYNSVKVIGKFLYYCLNTNEKQKEMKDRSGITTIPDLNHFMFLDMKIPLPDYDYQLFTVKILDSISKKIEINNKINAELEGMAKLIYEYWFVQFDFPFDFAQGKPADDSSDPKDVKPYKSSGGKMVWNKELKREIPEGWEVKLINSIIEVKDGTHESPKSKSEGYHLITSKNLQVSGLDFGNANLISEEDYFSIIKRSNVETGDILFSMIGNIGTIYKVEEKEINFAIKNVALFKTSSKKEYKNYIYMFLKSIDMDRYMKNIISGSIQKFIGLNSLRNTPILLDETFILKYNLLTHSTFIKLEKLKIENQKLTELRDWLLPMLMNGQVRVREVESELSLAAEAPRKAYEKG
jgi:type I restriction enzyme, S subunit